MRVFVKLLRARWHSLSISRSAALTFASPGLITLSLSAASSPSLPSEKDGGSAPARILAGKATSIARQFAPGIGSQCCSIPVDVSSDIATVDLHLNHR